MYFLQSSQATDDLIIWAIFGLLGFVFAVWIVQLVFHVQDRVRHERAQIFLLMQLWKKEGATDEEIKKFLKDFKIK
jgi:hypothetical protein